MKPLTLADLENLAAQPPRVEREFVRVQLDTGGIAAGAEAWLVMNVRCGADGKRQSCALSYANPPSNR